MTDSGKLALNKHIQWLYFSRGLAQLGRTGGSFKKYYSAKRVSYLYIWKENASGLVERVVQL